MKLGPSRGSTAVPALVAALVLLGVGAALATRGPHGSSAPHPSPSRGTLVPRPQESPSRTAGPGRPDGPAAAPTDPAPSDACAAALAEGEAALADARGLGRAIARVSENCVRNPQAAGLLRALRRLERERGPSGGGEGPPQDAPPGAEEPGRRVGPRAPDAGRRVPRAVGPPETSRSARPPRASPAD